MRFTRAVATLFAAVVSVVGWGCDDSSTSTPSGTTSVGGAAGSGGSAAAGGAAGAGGGAAGGGGLPAADVAISPSGHYFSVAGATVMMLGDSGTQCVMQNTNIDFEAWADTLAAEGHGTAHIWAFVPPRQRLDGSEVEDRYGYLYPGITPWVRQPSGPLAHDGGYPWDLHTFDEGSDPNAQYWPRLRALCERLRGHGLPLGITVFFGWPKDVPADLEYHPFYHLNGGPAQSLQDITHLDTPGTEVHSEPWDDGWPVRKRTQWLWEQFALRLIEEADHCGNVWFDFRDEWSYENDTNFEDHFREFFRSRGQIWADRTDQADFRVANPQVPPFGATPAMKTEGEPYDHDGVRQEVWTRATTGIHYLLHNDGRSPGIMAFDPNVGTDPADDDGRQYVGLAARFFNQSVHELDAMVPSDGLVSTGHCLAAPGQEYVVYLVGGGTVDVDLGSVTGALAVTWLDPRTGNTTDGGSVVGGTTASLTAPDANDWVLHLLAP